MTILFEPNRQWGAYLAALLGAEPHYATRLEDVQRLLAEHPDELLVLFGPSTDERETLEFAAQQRLTRPALGVLLLREHLDVTALGYALRAGVR